MFAGNFNIAASRSKIPSTAIPTNLKGKSSNQTIGYNTKIRIAKGAQNNNNSNHRIIFI